MNVASAFAVFCIFAVVGFDLPLVGAWDDTNCVVTQGYWKTHPAAWWFAIADIGNVTYDQVQMLAILNHPVAGNRYIALAHQLIAAMLNVAAGANASSEVLDAIIAANNIIGDVSLYPEPSASPPKSQSLAIRTTHEILDSFNEGHQGTDSCIHRPPYPPPPPPPCAPTPVSAMAMYTQSGVTVTVNLSSVACSDTGNVSVVVHGDQDPGGSCCQSFAFYHNLPGWHYTSTHKFEADAGACACGTCPYCIEAVGGPNFATVHDAMYPFFGLSPGVHRFTYVYGVRQFGHGYFDVAADLDVVVQ